MDANRRDAMLAWVGNKLSHALIRIHGAATLEEGLYVAYKDDLVILSNLAELPKPVRKSVDGIVHDLAVYFASADPRPLEAGALLARIEATLELSLSCTRWPEIVRVCDEMQRRALN